MTSVVFCASLAGRPAAGGHAWFVLTWLRGLSRLGCRVLFVDVAEDDSQWPLVRDVAARAGVDAALVVADGTVLTSASGDVTDQFTSADVLIDVMGFLGDSHPELVALPRLQVFLDVDPGVGQQWAAAGLHDPYGRYQRHVTVGTRVGLPGCAVPTMDRRWTRILPPVLLESWPMQTGPGAAVTSVGLWRGPNAPLMVDGVRHGQRVHEFRRYLSLPERAAYRFEMALAFEEWDGADRASLTAAGWQLADPRTVAADLDTYRDFVQASAAEFCVARQSYVRSRGGWVSDRSAAYLASGRPVVTSDTGACLLPAGAGFFAVDGIDAAAAAFDAIASAPQRHAVAAREIAETHLDSDQVLAGLLDDLGACADRCAA